MKITGTPAQMLRDARLVHLQGVGKVRAVPAGELKIGSVTMWNYGGTATVETIAPKGALSLSITMRTDAGLPWTRTFRRDRLVAVAKHEG